MTTVLRVRVSTGGQAVPATAHHVRGAEKRWGTCHIPPMNAGGEEEFVASLQL